MKLSYFLLALAISLVLPIAAQAATDSPQRDNNGIEVVAKLIGKDGKPLSGVQLIIFKVNNKVSVVQEVRGGKVVGPTGKSDKNGKLVIPAPRDYLKAGDNFTLGTENSWLTKNGGPDLFTWPTVIKNNKIELGDVRMDR